MYLCFCSVEEQGKGWVGAKVIPVVPLPNGYAPQQRDLQTGAILILTSQKPPARQVQNWLQRGLAAAAAKYKAQENAELSALKQEQSSRSTSPEPGEMIRHTLVPAMENQVLKPGLVLKNASLKWRDCPQREAETITDDMPDS